MKLSFSFCTILFYLVSGLVTAQVQEIRGKITDLKTGEPLAGAYIVIKDEEYGTVSDDDGLFKFETRHPPPVTLHISFMGYVPVEVEVKSARQLLDIKLEEEFLLGQEVVISASRVAESIIQSPVSIEKLNLRDLNQISNANFYDGLYQLKGVDMNVHGLTLQVPNARGFNDYSNYRMIQIVDGVESIAPGLGFFAGNLSGLSEIDISSLEMVEGASTALYGPGGMNGTLVMQSKNPFKYQGLATLVQTGLMNISNPALANPTPMYKAEFRFARAFSNRTALKITGTFLSATDWKANDTRDRADLNNPSLDRITDPGYDGVNIYGDETFVSVNLKEIGPQIIDQIAASQGIANGTLQYNELFNSLIQYFPNQAVTRTGWPESGLFPEKTKNIKMGGSFHYFITNRTEAIIQANFAQGTTVFTAQNRFAARGFDIFGAKAEINNPDYYFRIWGVGDNSGSSFDVGTAALRLNELWKPSEKWFSDYITAYTQTAIITGDLSNAHQFARLVADNRDPKTGIVFDLSKPAIPLPGATDFRLFMDTITSKSINEGGARVYDNSKIYQTEGMYNFNKLIPFMEMQAGVSDRVSVVDSKGTVFADAPGKPIYMNQFGAFVQVNKNFLYGHLRITGAFRYDKNQYFRSQYTPRFSLIGYLDKNKEHNIRATIQTAYRFPSPQDEWVDVNAGYYRVIGGMARIQNKYNFGTIPLYPMSGRNPITDKPITEDGPIMLPEFKPEKVASLEFGYRGLMLRKNLFLDTYSYYNRYRGFEAGILVAELAKDAGTPNDLIFQTVISTNHPVSSWGWAVGADYRTNPGMLIRGNVAFDKLLKWIQDPGIESAFNTPRFRANLSVSHHSILPNLRFGLNIHWQEKFFWESTFGNAEIPAFTTCDAHVSRRFPSIHSELKLGGSNIFNKYYTTSFGSAQIGALFYLTFQYGSVLSETVHVKR